MTINVKTVKPTWQSRMKLWLILGIILALGVCALPNLYQNKTVLNINTTSAAKALPSLNELSTLLVRNDFAIEQISVNDVATIELSEQTRSANAQTLLLETYENQLQVKIVEVATAPIWLQRLGLAPIKLGLDLNGGVLFVLKVDIEKALEKRMENIALEANALRIKEKLRGVNIERRSNTAVNLVAKSNALESLTQLTTSLKTLFPQLQATEQVFGNDIRVTLSLDEAGQAEFSKQTMTQALTTLRSRIAELGITEAVTQRQGANYIRIELPGVQDPAAAKRIIGATAQLSFHALKEVGGKIVDGEYGKVSIDPLAIFSGADIDSAQAGRDEYGKPQVQLQLSSQGGDKMMRFSRANVGKPMATLYSEYQQDHRGEIQQTHNVISVATISQALGQRFSITNMSSWQKAQDLALLLRAGSLEAPLTIVTERTIGPSLGAQNIQSGFKALALGLSLTLAFMLLWYRKLGVIACIALVANIVCLIGLMSLIPGIVLTLPGIAGLVLTIGMAVDTNVIIFERIKEELKQGSSMMAALLRGYKQAQTSIIDANLTTMITALVLMAIGYGPIKGFAITLSLGILTSMFCGVIVSAQLSHWFYAPRKAKGAQHG
ncbi:Protein-export membrane protein SecD (TC 3.A.5.1.1) [Pseudoalteromonas luteoviolacea B = ATCC 29581]|nr:Protein-export membrane protein SecD (TC 3.A.5.1.1) [Pseudoalteromonas luteoviolacea B = ATCC 29581]